jgi:carbon storage regulator CsrA
MLVLSRRAHEKILIPAIRTSIQVLNIRSNAVRLGIDAPLEIDIVRDEIAGANLASEGSLGSREALIQTRDELLRGRDELLRGREELLREREESLKGRQELLKRQRGLLLRGLHQNKLLVQVALARLDLSLLSGEVQKGMGRSDLLQTIDRIEQGLHLLEQKLENSTGPKLAKTLIVEDNQNERELLAGFIRMAGVEVVATGDSVDALDYLHREPRKPDVMLLNVALPSIDGLEVVRKVRSDPACGKLKIFAISGQDKEQEMPVDRWFRKPLNPEVLLDELLSQVG